MSNDSQVRDFLTSLLSLQQDGSQAISAPTNWTKSEPLLQVETELDEIVQDLATEALGGDNQQKKGRWHFFIGSPGNGKSAAVGKLSRALLKQGCTIKDETGTDIRSLDESVVPYSLNVYRDGDEHVSLVIVQDASVVRNPYGDEADPAQDLWKTLQDCWKKGVSLVLCTNRGVIEKARMDLIGESGSEEVWFKAVLKPLAENIFKTRTLPVDPPGVFSEVQVEYTPLDNKSLILGENTFTKLLEKATEIESWEKCSRCEAAGLCPFKANRDWLADQTNQKKFTQLIKRAEVLSAQVIVFREALALISFILAGCRKDYGAESPCQWVKRLIEHGDMFALLSRRIYASIFMSYGNRGFDDATEIRDNGLGVLGHLPDSSIGEKLADTTKKSLSCLIAGGIPSSDVGVSRLLGEGGIFSRLDSIRGPLPDTFFEKWGREFSDIKKENDCGFTGLEEKCAEIWNDVEKNVEDLESDESQRAYRYLKRWASGFLLRLGAIQEERVVDQMLLDDFSDLLELLRKNSSERTPEEQRKHAKFESQVNDLLNNSNAGGVDKIRLSRTVVIAGQWPRSHLYATIQPSSASGSLTASVEFQGSRAESSIDASIYLWLRKRSEGIVDERCLPEGLLLDALDAKVAAASQGNYSNAKGVELEILAEPKTFSLKRIPTGEVLTDED